MTDDIDTGIARKQSLKELIKNLYNELSLLGEEKSDDDNRDRRRHIEDNCKNLIQAIAALQPSRRTAGMDKLLILAKHKAGVFSSRASFREFRWHIAAIEKCCTPAAAAGDAPQVHKKKKAPNKKNSATATKIIDNSNAESGSSYHTLTVAEYLDRLKRQSKDLYKNPPKLPPPTVEIYNADAYHIAQEPQRDRSGRFCFEASLPSDTFQIILKQFRPNRSPEEILRAGAFGGTYFRTITSAVTNQQYIGSQVVRDTLPESWRKGIIDEAKYLTSSKYRVEINKYLAKCGGSLGMWESSGWIADSDPYGWFQWYCRFFRGRRSSDDVRQIQRWMGVAGPKGRFKSQLCNKILAAQTHVNDTSISPVIRQTLWHWGLEVTPEILQEHQATTTRR